jgi:predicted anti-sigma-YlaC factor YlaD
VTNEDIPCRQIVEMVTDYLEGALSSENVSIVDAHLATCDGCAEYFDQMRVTIRMTGTVEADDIPPQVLGPLLDAFRNLREDR